MSDVGKHIGEPRGLWTAEETFKLSLSVHEFLLTNLSLSSLKTFVATLVLLGSDLMTLGDGHTEVEPTSFW